MKKLYFTSALSLFVALLGFTGTAEAQCTVNYLQNPSFETPVGGGLGNNFYDQSVPGNEIPNWTISTLLTANIVRTDGVTVYGGGPNAAAAGVQYLDILTGGGDVTFTQTFVLGCTADLTFRGDFAAREGGLSWTAFIEIVNASNVVVATSTVRNSTPPDADNDPAFDAIWYTVNGTATALPAGTYTYRVTLPEDANFDNAFLCASPGCLLPVTLKAFDVKLNSCVSSAKWSATEETNLSNYTLEYSKNGIDFTAVSVVDASGINKEYSVQHVPANGKAFYRLKMVDLDGKVAYSKLQVLNINCSKNTILVYPNPVSDNLNINVNFVGGVKTASATLYDISGRLVVRKLLTNGTNTIDMGAISSGIYNLVVVQDDVVTTYKIKR
ncbi:MAG: T9SS type A sorting domain-containing protein [Chitinophagales bacterium]|nr:T9SS type A sorting domain-containing protein [Chitinophagales bacterium]